MNLVVHRRAEIAFRSLTQTERNKILKAFSLLEDLSLQDLAKSGKLKMIHAASGESLYLYRSSSRLRIVLSRNNNVWTVEDIVDHDRLERLLPRGNRP